MAKLIQKTTPWQRDYCTRTELPKLLGCGQWTCDKLIKQTKAGARVNGRLIVNLKKIMEYLDSITEEEQGKNQVLNRADLKELRCSCGKLLGKSNAWTEITCPKCHAVRVFENGKLIEDAND